MTLPSVLHGGFLGSSALAHVQAFEQFNMSSQARARDGDPTMRGPFSFCTSNDLICSFHTSTRSIDQTASAAKRSAIEACGATLAAQCIVAGSA